MTRQFENYLHNRALPLAKQAKLQTEPDTLRRLALQWELYHPGRTPRTARQFVELVKAEEELRHGQ